MNEQLNQHLLELQEELNSLKAIKDFYTTLESSSKTIINNTATQQKLFISKVDELINTHSNFITQNSDILSHTLGDFATKVHHQNDIISSQIASQKDIQNSIHKLHTEVEEGSIQRVAKFRAELDQLFQETSKKQQSIYELFEEKHAKIFNKYDALHERYDKTLDGIKHEISPIHKAITTLENRFDKVDQKAKEQEELLLKSIKLLEEMNDRFTQQEIQHKKELDSLQSRIDSSNSSITQKLTELTSIIKANINWPWRKLS